MPIYLDESVLGPPMPGTTGTRVVDADVVTALRHLRESGHEIVAVGELRLDESITSELDASVPSIPDQRLDGSWYLTADPAACSDRRPGLRIVLIGPQVSGRAAITRCDLHARDLSAAVLEILAAELPTPVT
jgi:hypothetical protein